MIQTAVRLDLSREPRVAVRAQSGFCIQRYGHGSSSPRCCGGGCYLCFRAVEMRTLGGSQGHKHKREYGMVRCTVNQVEKCGGGKKKNRNAIVKWASDL